MTVDPKLYKSPLIAKAIEQALDAWFDEQHRTTGNMATGPAEAKDIEGEFDLAELGRHIAGQLGF